jgi:hypothetical protein
MVVEVGVEMEVGAVVVADTRSCAFFNDVRGHEYVINPVHGWERGMKHMCMTVGSSRILEGA